MYREQCVQPNSFQGAESPVISLPTVLKGSRSECFRRPQATKHVRFDWSVQFWFPAPDQICLPRRADKTAPTSSASTRSVPVSDGCFRHPAIGRSSQPCPSGSYSCPGLSPFVQQICQTQADLCLGGPLETQQQEHGPNRFFLKSNKELLSDPCSWEFTTPICCCHSSLLAALPEQFARGFYYARTQAIRTGATPYVPPSARGRTGFSRPLEAAGHTLAVDTSVVAPDTQPCLPFTSFDERNGVRVLTGGADWGVQQFISLALNTAQLPGHPVARIVGYEVVSFPGPQVALTQDRGSDYRRAVVIDFRSHAGELLTVDLPPGTSVHMAFSFVPAFPALHTIVADVSQNRVVCFVNGVAFDPTRMLPADVDVIQFLTAPDGAAPPFAVSPVRATSLALPHLTQQRGPSLDVQGVDCANLASGDTLPFSLRPLLPGDARPPTPPVPEVDSDDDPDGVDEMHPSEGAPASSSAAPFLPQASAASHVPDEPCDAGTGNRVTRWSATARRFCGQPATSSATPPPLLPLSPLELADCCNVDSPSQLFTVFDVHHHVRELAAPATFTGQQLARLAFSLTPEIDRPYGYRFVRHLVEGFERPQLVIWDYVHTNSKILPVVYPGLKKGVCTVAAAMDASPLQVMIEVGRQCGTPARDRHDLLPGRTTFKLDSVVQDPWRPQALRHSDSASFHREPVDRYQTASLTTPAIGQPARPSREESLLNIADGVWLPVNPALLDEQGIADVFIDTERPGIQLREVIAHSFGRGPCRFWISSLRTPADLSRIITARLRHAESTLLWPQVAPCLPGLPCHVVVLPAATPANQHFALVDARRVHPTGGMCFWPIRVPLQLRAESVIEHALAGRQICITPTCATVDGLRRHGDFTLNSRIAIFTLHGNGCTGRNCVFDNIQALFHMPGFLQEAMRHPCALAESALLTSTSTTTTGTVPTPFPRAPSRGAICSPGNVNSAPVHVFASCGNCRPVEIIVESTTTIESLLASICDRLVGRTRIPPRASWFLSRRLHWLGNGDPALFFASGWGSFEPRESIVWIDAFPLWHSPYLTVVPHYADIVQLLRCVHVQGAGQLNVAIDGVMWHGESRFILNGAVIQFRPRPIQLATLPVYSVQDRIAGICAAQIHCEGPDLSTWTFPPSTWFASFEEHFSLWASRFRAAYEPTPEFNTIYLVVQCGPCIRISLHTPLPPTLSQVQRAYDDLLQHWHGPRQIEDTKFCWDDCCIYIARRADFPSNMWFVLNGPAFDVVQLDTRLSLYNIPAPEGCAWFPQEVRGNVGIAICRNAHLLAPPGLDRLDALDERPPFVEGQELFAHDFFGSDSEGYEGASASTSSPSPSSSRSEDTAATSSRGLSLLQHRATLKVPQLAHQLRCLPTPCRAPARHRAPKCELCLADATPPPPSAFSFGVEESMVAHCLEEHAFSICNADLLPSLHVAGRFRRLWNLLPVWHTTMRIDEAFLFTDGSYDPVSGRAAWAVVAIVRCGKDFVRLGIAADELDARSGAPNAHVAETEALLHAEAISLRLDAPCSHIIVDCQSALQVAAGAARTSSDDVIARACNGLQLLHAALGRRSFRHKISAHRGHMPNEVADSAAKAVVFRRETGMRLGSLQTFWQAVDDRTLEWLWLTAQCMPAALPPLCDNGSWTSASCRAPPSTAPTSFGLAPLEREPDCFFAFGFTALQYNTLSLRGEAAMQMLQLGLSRHMVHIAGLQETRTPRRGISSQGDYWVVASPCDARGNGGCQVWLNAKLSLCATGPSLNWDRKSLSVVHSETQILAMLADAGPFKFAVVSAHAPTSPQMLFCKASGVG